MNFSHCSPFGCILESRSVLGGGDLAHLSSSLPPSICGCSPSFISHGGSLSFIHCCLLHRCWQCGPCFLYEQWRGEGDTHCSPGHCPSFIVVCGHCLAVDRSLHGDEQQMHLSFDRHVADSDMAPGFHVRKMSGGE